MIVIGDSRMSTVVPRMLTDVSQALVNEFGRLPTRRAVTSFLKRHEELREAATVDRLHDEVVRVVLTDVPQAERLARAARQLADMLGDDRARAQSMRAAGHVLFVQGRYPAALEFYEQALALFRRLGLDFDMARTQMGALQTLIFLGRYDRAFAAAAEAREIFERYGDRLRLARLDSNLGNILNRQDRFEEALARYQSAYEELSARGEPRDVAAVLLNIAVCFISLNDFEQALATYHRVRAYCREHDLSRLVVQADYNIAYLYYLRGEYSKAVELYRQVQVQCEEIGDVYHRALCDLDRSELYLELNLNEEGGGQAERALTAFDQLGMPYEAAKARMNVALAAGQRGETAAALELFSRARTLFRQEGNPAGQALVDLYRAVILHRRGRAAESAQRCRSALGIFRKSGLHVKAAYCELLLARLALEKDDKARASRHANIASDLLCRAEAPALVYQAEFVLGLVAEAAGDEQGALHRFELAHSCLEQLRSHIHGEDLKVAFLKDKVPVYEALVSVSLASGSHPKHVEAAFGYIEQSKSRSLADLIAVGGASLKPRARPEDVEEVVRLRQELNWHAHRISVEELRRDRRSSQRIENLRRRTRALEMRLLGSLGELRNTDEEFASLQGGAVATLADIQASLEPESVLLEYYQARGRMYVAIVSRKGLEIVPLAPAARIRRLLRLLQFQLSKFRFDATYTTAFARELREATEAHLFELHSELVAPIHSHMGQGHLIVVPHDFLHCLPFHALFDGERFLIDDFTVSYAPSASVYRLCRLKPAVTHETSLLMGIPDAAAPYITEEIQAVSSLVPSPVVFMGTEATDERLRTVGSASSLIHIATHGLFRRDNPMFSSITLGNGPLRLFDLYDLDLSAELVTLSGCSTGVNAVIGGDEVVGLVRGLLYSGARSVLLTLWDAYDRSTSTFMQQFYSALAASGSKKTAFQEAMRRLREEYPHPFYWAPFVLVGREDAMGPGAGGSGSAEAPE
jgi:CHAT domain-containing protein/tetratricopeptide (TPR) repeat protein